MTVIRNNSISGINSITAQSNSLNFYDTSGNTLSIGASVTGNVTGNLTGDVNAGVVTATSSIVVGNSFINATSIGIGTTTTAGRNAGVGTAFGTLIYDATTDKLEVYGAAGWITVKSVGKIEATGGTKDTSSRPGYAVHTFTGDGTFTITAGQGQVEYLVIAGGAGGGGAGAGNAGGGGAGGYRLGAPSGTSGGGGSAETPTTWEPGSYTVTV